MKRWIFIVDALILASVFSAAQSPSADKSAPPSSANPDSNVSQPVHISSGAAMRLLTKRVPPNYPKDARRAHVQGTVTLKARIDKAGNVEDVTFSSGDPVFASAAMEAARQWRYKPYVLNGQPVAAEFDIKINFELQ